FTSGSTGRPKGVVLSHRANVLRSWAPNTSTPVGATVCMFPLFHMAAWTIALGCWQAREEVAFVVNPDADSLLGAVDRRAGSPFLMDGYFEDEEATAAALVDGWYHTGDLGGFDEDGYLSIVGRRRDVIRTGGETVAPPEVEAALADHPAVADVAVVGLPDPAW